MTSLDPDRWVPDHGEALLRFAQVRLRDHDAACEAVQETLAAALGARDSFAGQASERTWLIAILKRKVVDEIRRRARTGPTSEDARQIEGDLFERGFWRRRPADWPADPGASMQQQEFWDALEACLAALPERTGQAFVLRELDGLDTAEICEILALTPTNLSTLLHRARLRLRECLSQRWFGGAAGDARA
ncbi:MAG: sigma-70 family RNA polymerase sigma factor [Phycisphaerales bacterium JB039]